MHQFDPDALSEHQRILATAANAIVLQIHARLKALTANTLRAETAANIRAELAPCFARLAIAEADLWHQTRAYVLAAEANASTMANILANPTPDAVKHVTACAAQVATALRAMTSLQRDTMLADPIVAFASNIAFDCETEFDNDEALHRWTQKAKSLGPANR